MAVETRHDLQATRSQHKLTSITMYNQNITNQYQANLFPTQAHMVVTLQFNKISNIVTYHKLNWKEDST